MFPVSVQGYVDWSSVVLLFKVCMFLLCFIVSPLRVSVGAEANGFYSAPKKKTLRQRERLKVVLGCWFKMIF